MHVKILLVILLVVVTFCSCDDETPKSVNMEGTWAWESSCGGFVGCVYSNSTDQMTLTITDTLLEINERGKIVMSGPYTIKSVTGDGHSKTYEIELSDGTIWTASIKGNVLTVEYAVITSVYKRRPW